MNEPDAIPGTPVPNSRADVLADTVESHVRAFFAGHEVESVPYDMGSRADAVPGLRLLVAGPGPSLDCWTYVTAGNCANPGQSGERLEFVMTANARDQRYLDLAAMVAYYNATYPLGLGHSMPLGEPVLPGATCDHLLISLPYLHGPTLENCPLPNGSRAQLLWLLPVTAAEIAFRREHDTETLEQRFDDASINPNDPFRPSVA